MNSVAVESVVYLEGGLKEESNGSLTCSISEPDEISKKGTSNVIHQKASCPNHIFPSSMGFL